jgi:hypothetical protein
VLSGRRRAAYGKTPPRLEANTDGGTEFSGNFYFYFGPDIPMESSMRLAFIGLAFFANSSGEPYL